MPSTFIDIDDGSYNGTEPRNIADLPRGIITVPPHLAAIEAEHRARFPPDIYTDTYSKDTLDDWTLHYYFADLSVAYRSVPEGVEVLAVGGDEIGDLVKGMSQEELLTFWIKVP